MNRILFIMIFKRVLFYLIFKIRKNLILLFLLTEEDRDHLISLERNDYQFFKIFFYIIFLINRLMIFESLELSIRMRN